MTMLTYFDTAITNYWLMPMLLIKQLFAIKNKPLLTNTIN